MYFFRFLNTPLGGGGAATQTFAPGAANTLAPPLVSFACSLDMTAVTAQVEIITRSRLMLGLLEQTPVSQDAGHFMSPARAHVPVSN